jgi:ribosomal protein L7/L12
MATEKKVKGLISEKTIVLKYDGQEINIQKKENEEQFKKIAALIISGDEKALKTTFMDIKKRLEKFSSDTVSVENGRVILKGTTQALPDAITKKLLEMEADGSDFLPLVRFWKKLSQNPSKGSREQLYGFMIANKIPLTEQGDIVVAKGVMQKHGSMPGHLVDCYTKTVDNTVGMVVEMPRDKVNENPNQTCSHGLHVGAQEYVRNYYSQDIIVECVVNPIDVVSVPTDYSNTKMRVCKYQVMGYSNKSRNTGGVVKLSEFFNKPTKAQEDKMAIESKTDTPTRSASGNGIHNETVKSIKQSSVVEVSPYEAEIANKTAKEIVDYVKEKTGKEITGSLRKQSVVKKAIVILEMFGGKALDQSSAGKITVQTKNTTQSNTTKTPTQKKGDWNVLLESSGGQKLAVVKAIKEMTKLVLKEAKELADKAGQDAVVFSKVDAKFAEWVKNTLNQLGATAIAMEVLTKENFIDLSVLSRKEIMDLVKARFNETINKFANGQAVINQAQAIFEKAGFEVKL